MMSASVSGADLKSGFAAMSELLGTSSTKKLLDYFESAGISFDGGSNYSIDHIERIFQLIFGEAAGLIVQDLKKNIITSQNE